MKPRSIPNFIGMFLLVAGCFASSNARAYSVRAREIQAVVQAIDCQKRVLTLIQVHGQQKLIWKADTQFLCGRKLVPAVELKAGTHLTVYYHAPFFGKPFITKAVWLDKP